MTLRLDWALDAIGTAIAAPIGRDLLAAAWSIHNVINETMAAAVRLHMTERGGLLDRVTLVAFGGAGPVHAYNLAAKLGIPQLVVPPRAGVLSALGLIVTPPAYHVVRTCRAPLSDLAPAAIEAAYAQIEAEIERILREVEPDGAVSFARAADVGYIGQGYQVGIDTDDLRGGLHADALWYKFAAVYRAKYGYFYDDVPAELVNLRVSGRMRGHPFRPGGCSGARRAAGDGRKGARQAYSSAAGGMIEFAVYDRVLLAPGRSIAGPAVIEETSSTTVVDAGGTVQVDDHGCLVILIARAGR
jgi:N-methylhydantoinase A